MVWKATMLSQLASQDVNFIGSFFLLRSWVIHFQRRCLVPWGSQLHLLHYCGNLCAFSRVVRVFFSGGKWCNKFRMTCGLCEFICLRFSCTCSWWVIFPSTIGACLLSRPKWIESLGALLVKGQRCGGVSTGIAYWMGQWCWFHAVKWNWCQYASWASASLHLAASSWAAPGCHDGFASATARA